MQLADTGRAVRPYANRFGSLVKAYELIGYDHRAVRARRRPAELARAHRTRRRKAKAQ
jgi:hypothetical protein